MKRLVAIVCMALVGMVIPAISYAQGLPQYEDAAIQSSPEFPGPFQNVTVTLNSFSVPLDARMITWYVNGTEFQRGIGKKQITVRTSGIGTVTRVAAIVDVNALIKVNKVIELRPNSVDLLWEAIDSYVPPFYRGKALPSAEGALRVTAISIGAANPSALVFTWLRNNIISQSDSGFSRSSLSTRNSVLEDSTDLGVQVVSPDGSYQAQNRIVIPRANPFIRFKISEPGVGTIYAKQGTSKYVPFSQFLVTAEPFYVSSRSGNFGLSFKWQANDEDIPVESGGESSELFLSNPKTGSLDLSVKTVHDRFLLQEAGAKVTLGFAR